MPLSLTGCTQRQIEAFSLNFDAKTFILADRFGA